MNNENKDYEGIVLSENAEKAEAVENVQIPDNPGTGKTITEEKTKKKKGRFVKFLVFLIVLIAIIAGGGYYYLHYMCTSDKLIDYSVKKMNSKVDLLFTSAVNYNILEDDYLGTGTMELSSSEKDYEFLNGLKLDYKIGTSIGSDYVSFTGNVSQGTGASIEAAAFVNQDNLFVDLKDMYYLLINYNLGENYFNTIKEELQKSSDITVDDFHKIANKAVFYLGEAFKEVSSSTAISGGIYVEYKFDLNKDNYKKFNDKYKELLLNDEQFKELNEIYEFIDEEEVQDTDYDEYWYYTDTLVTVKVNAITREIESFSIKSDDVLINGKRIDKNKYKITYDKTVINIEITDNKIVIDNTEDGRNVTKFSMNLNNEKAVVNFINYDNNMEANAEVIKISNNEMKINTEVNYEGIKVNNSLFNKFGKSLVKKEEVTNSRKYEELSENEINYIQNNLMKKLEKFKAYEEYSKTTYEPSNNYYIG